MKEQTNSDSEDYERIATAIAFIRQNYRNQPDLTALAEHIGISKYHLQKLFTRWAGISPKRFLQYLTIEEAKAKIDRAKNLLDLTLDIGLSSPGRLHDLFINFEAMSPGEFKTGAAGLQIYYGIHDTPFGKALIATTNRGICNLFFLERQDRKEGEKILRQSRANAEIIFAPQQTQPLHDRIFQTKNFNNQPLTVTVKGTNFQIQVWQALLKIPFGSIVTYQSIASSIGNPKAVRAVGTAIGNNPISYLIPCHRVIRSSGALGGYRWGLDRKSVMLDWEACRCLSQTQEIFPDSSS